MELCACEQYITALRRLIEQDRIEDGLDGADFDKLSHLLFLLQTNDDTFMEQRMDLISEPRKKDSF